MAYDEKLAQRVRDLLAGDVGVTEKRMFGGLAFLIGGNMAVTASHRGGLMIRVDPAAAVELIAGTPASQIEMRGRPMPGWLHVRDPDLRTKRQLARWVGLAAAYTRSLPTKGDPKGRAGSQARAGGSL
jgi:TfoX/Sxy family transcriptional regulator of competence genes